MRKNSLFLLPLALLLWGCPGQSNEEPEPEKTCLLQEHSSIGVNGGVSNATYSSRYTYNTDGRLSVVARDSAGIEKGKTVFTYDSRGNLVQEENNYTKVVNEYDKQNRLVKQTKFLMVGPTANSELYLATFSYTSTGDLAETRYYSPSTGPATPRQILRYKYTNGNPTHITHLDGQERVEVQSLYTFDAHPAPRPTPDILSLTPQQAPAVNNMLSATHTNNRGYTTRYDIDYTYQGNGYPATAIIKFPNNNQVQLAFRYTCI
ncbi:hypothetical protein [Pontibacter akesuensis]|uniref:YD repeat-containing protein n=1 Tax=Pontibacter akesuensis TaxID=388950 RepID=A0A1I7GD79_9BACT|nr:hypothetical protein [Pontibacter akesuensis]GHA57445.1 hypothetical protein GCM10007389_06430 [Pontibacter akesuensis]SFU46414.1 hypothetical protein SAMN04487941_0928 [Pontibacter akesuensis]